MREDMSIAKKEQYASDDRHPRDCVHRSPTPWPGGVAG